MAEDPNEVVPDLSSPAAMLAAALLMLSLSLSLSDPSSLLELKLRLIGLHGLALAAEPGDRVRSLSSLSAEPSSSVVVVERSASGTRWGSGVCSPFAAPSAPPNRIYRQQWSGNAPHAFED